jgi:CHAT domain-containing protein/Tfp pilus assembly protein PilF
MFDGIGSADRLGAARELMQRGELEGALAEVDRVIGLGKSVEALELKSEILGAIVGRNQVVLKVSAEEWFDRGHKFYEAGDFENAINSYDHGLLIKPESCEAWTNRGLFLSNLGRFEEALASYESALEINLDNATTWHQQAVFLEKCGRYEEAIRSYRQSLEINPNSAYVWYGLGISTARLEKYTESIFAYNHAIEIQPDFPEAWTNKGRILNILLRYEEAILSFKNVLTTSRYFPEIQNTWTNQGLSLLALGRYEEAIDSCEKALHYKPDHYAAWGNRSDAAFLGKGLKQQDNVLISKHPELNQRGYQGCVASIMVGLTYCPIATHSQGHGILQKMLGDAHWNYARTQGSPRPYWREARKAYNASLQVLTAIDHPEERLQTLQKLIRTHDALREIAPDAMLALLRQGTELRTRILTQARSDEQRDRLSRTLPNFNELTVDFYLSQGNNIAALETAEADKNGLMQWLLTVPGTANYAEMRETIDVDTAIVYWYLGANAIATFVLRADQVEPIVVTEFDREISLKMRDRLDEWIKKWNKSYNPKDKAVDRLWKKSLKTELETLAEILAIPKLLSHLQNIQNLILVPHRDLHRFPLHTFFPQAKITYLPSLHLGRHLRPAQHLAQTQLLSIEAPAHKDADPLYHAGIESIALRYLHPNHLYLAPKQSDQSTFLHAIAQPHTHLHFNGHANHNPDNPKQSELMLRGDDTLTLNTFRQSPYYPSQIVTLAACETGITNAQTITAEYVGWVSAFLSRDVPYVLSTLWTVHSEATALFMMQFYRQLQRHQSPVIAHHQAQQWLRHLTVQKLTRLYQIALPHQTGKVEVFEFLEIELLKLGKMEKSALPYVDPYYWAAFILSGRPNSL